MRGAKLLPWLTFPAALALLLHSLSFPGGEIGHDYRHAFARLWIGADFFWKNGLALPHFTAHLCGGIPFLADPQSTYFSVAQGLTFLLDPWNASLTTIAAFAALGYFGFLVWLREALSLRGGIAHFVSLAFLLNGFTYANLLVGHLTHHGYFLAPWLLVFLFRRHESFGSGWRRDVGLTSLLGLYLLFSGGLHVLVVFAFLALVALPASLARQRGPARKPFLGLLAGAFTLTALGGSAKILSGASYARVFYSHPLDVVPLPWWRAIQIYFWFDPQTTPPLIRFTNWDFGAWEYVGFVTKLTIPALFPALLLFRRHRPVALATGAAAALTVFLALGGNGGVALLRHYHNPLKVLGAGVPLLLTLLAWSLADAGRRLTTGYPRLGPVFRSPWFFLAAALLLVGEFHQNARFFRSIPQGGGFRWQPAFLSRPLPVVERVTSEAGDLEAMAKGETSLACFEPLFGYRQETYKAELLPGPVNEAANGYFNLTHPGCLLYPEHFGCRPWERVPEAERAALEALVDGRQPPWELPPSQTWLYRLGALIVGLCLWSSLSHRVKGWLAHVDRKRARG